MNLLKDIGGAAFQVFKTIAPTMATAAAGPFAPLVAPFINKIFGVDPSDPKAVQSALLSMTPEQALAMRQAENDFTLKMEELGIQKEQLVYQDIANARAREIAVKDSTPRFLAYLVTAGFFGTLGFLLVHGKPETGGDALLVMLGSLATAWAGIITYYYGSSSGSAAKTDALAALAKK